MQIARLRISKKLLWSLANGNISMTNAEKSQKATLSPENVENVDFEGWDLNLVVC